MVWVGLVPFQGVHLEEYSKARYLRVVLRRMDMKIGCAIL